MSEKAVNILSKFPKIRIDLPADYQKIYAQHYLINREGKSKTTSLSKKLEHWLHKQVAKDVKNKSSEYSTLEIGAGTLNQLDFEKSNDHYDIIEPFKELFEESSKLKQVRTVYNDIADVKELKYDRISSVAVFEHIMDLPYVVAKAALLLNDGGCLRTAIPNEGTIMWALGTKVTGREFKKRYGLDYKVLMTYEHVNTADDIEKVLDYFFERTERSVYGISKGLAFYRFYEHKNPRIEVAKEYLKSKNQL
jgi:Methyltransferase domain